jgi:hypothetical protein
VSAKNPQWWKYYVKPKSQSRCINSHGLYQEKPLKTRHMFHSQDRVNTPRVGKLFFNVLVKVICDTFMVNYCFFLIPDWMP